MINNDEGFVNIPIMPNGQPQGKYSAFVPIILMADNYDEISDRHHGSYIELEKVSTQAEALLIARVACGNTKGSCGYAVRGVADTGSTTSLEAISDMAGAI